MKTYLIATLLGVGLLGASIGNEQGVFNSAGQAQKDIDLAGQTIGDATDGKVTVEGGDILECASATQIDCDTDGKLVIRDTGGTKQFCMDFLTDAQVTYYDGADCSSAANVVVSGTVTATGGLTVAAGAEINEASGTVLDFASTDGVFRIRDSGKTKGARFVAHAAETVQIQTLAGASGGILDMSGGYLQFINSTSYRLYSSGGQMIFRSGEGVVIQQMVANSTATQAAMHVYGATMTAASGTQYGINLGPTNNQSSTAAFIALNIAPTDTTSGSGQDYLIYGDWAADATPEFTVQDDGVINSYDSSGNGAFWREFHIPASKTQPAAAGPTATFLNTATFVYLLDATTEYLYFGADIHDDWEGNSDVVIEVQVALSGAETASDNIQAEIVAEYVGEHGDIDTSIRTQTRSINHDIVSDNGQGDVHHLVFVLDEDLGSHEIAVDDNLSLRFRLDAVGGGTDVAAVWFVGANVKYRTSNPQLPTGGTFPSEG